MKEVSKGRMITREQLERNIDTEQGKQYQEETLYILKKTDKVCLHMQVRVYVCVHTHSMSSKPF